MILDAMTTNTSLHYGTFLLGVEIVVEDTLVAPKWDRGGKDGNLGREDPGKATGSVIAEGPFELTVHDPQIAGEKPGGGNRKARGRLSRRCGVR